MTPQGFADVFIAKGDGETEWLGYLNYPDGTPLTANSGPGGTGPGTPVWKGVLNANSVPPDPATLVGLDALEVRTILAEADAERYGSGAGRPPVPNQPTPRYCCAGGTDEEKIVVPGQVLHHGDFGGYFDALMPNPGDTYEVKLIDFEDALKCRKGASKAAGRPSGKQFLTASSQEWIDYRASGWAAVASFAKWVAANSPLGSRYQSPFVGPDGLWRPHPVPPPAPVAGETPDQLLASDLTDALAEAASAATKNEAPQAPHQGIPNPTDFLLPLGLHSGEPYAPQTHHLTGRWRDASGSGIIAWRHEDDASGFISSGVGLWDTPQVAYISVRRDAKGVLWVAGLTGASVTLVLTDLRPGAGVPRTFQSQGDQGFILHVSLGA